MDAQILLVKDDPSIREVTALGLRAAGFTVATAADGVEGLERWRADRPDLVLLDNVMLPRRDGLEVCRAIRREATTPIVMLTARADTIDVVVGLEAGADDYVRSRSSRRCSWRGSEPRCGAGRAGTTAPRRPRSYSATCGSTTRAERSIQRATDPAHPHRVRPARASSRRHLGCLFTARPLLDRVWGYDYLGDSLVDVAVRRLRVEDRGRP